MRQSSFVALVHGRRMTPGGARSLMNGGRAARTVVPEITRLSREYAREVGLTASDVLVQSPARASFAQPVTQLRPVGRVIPLTGDTDIDASIDLLLRSR
jgi:hypothetical protein